MPPFLNKLDRRYALVAVERAFIVASKAASVVLIARFAGPESLSVYAVGLAIAVWAGSLANFGSQFVVQGQVARSMADIGGLGTRGVRSSMTLGLLLAIPAAATHALLRPGEPIMLVALATALLVPSTAVTQMLGALVKGRNDFIGHLFGNAAEYLLFPISIVLVATFSGLTGARALLLFAASIWISNLVWWVRLDREVRFGLCRPRVAVEEVRKGHHGAGFQLGEAGAARLDLLVLAAIASPTTVGIYALVKQIVEALMHIPRVGGAILLNDAAAGATRSRCGRFALSGLQVTMTLPLLLLPSLVLRLAGGTAYQTGSSALQVLALAGIAWGWAYLRAHEELGHGGGRRATRWSMTLIVLVAPATLIGFELGGLVGLAGASLLVYILAGAWLWKPVAAERIGVEPSDPGSSDPPAPGTGTTAVDSIASRG